MLSTPSFVSVGALVAVKTVDAIPQGAAGAPDFTIGRGLTVLTVAAGAANGLNFRSTLVEPGAQVLIINTGATALALQNGGVAIVGTIPPVSTAGGFQGKGIMYFDGTNWTLLLPNAIPNGQAAFSGYNAAGTSLIRLILIDGSNRLQLLPDGVGDILWGKTLVALGGGAAPTLGTIGGTGPAAAAQNSWMRVVDNAGNPFWVPVWK